MATVKFLKAVAEAVADAGKENIVLVPNKTKGWLVPIRADKIKEFFGEDAPKVTEDPKWVENFAGAFYRLPVAGRAVIALRYGLFSGVSFTIGDVHRMTGLERQEVNAIEAQSRNIICTELWVTTPQQPSQHIPVHVKIRKKLRREARDGDC